MRLLKQNTTANVMVFMADAADHVTGKTGLTLTVSASKNGGAFQAISPLVTERGDGWYNLALGASVMDTLGDLALHITAAGADPTDLVCRVIAADLASSTNLGMSFLDATISSRAPASTALSNLVWTDAKAGFLAGTVATASGLSTAQAAILTAIDNLNDLNVSDVQTALTGQGYTAARAVFLDKLNVSGTLAHTGNADQFKANVSGLMLANSYVPPNNTGIAAAAATAAKLETMLEAAGQVFRYTAGALELAPSGGGGGTGAGEIPVDHHTGGTDAMRYLLSGQPADNVTIRAYLKSDYDAGTRVVRGTTRTGPDGRWLAPLMLDPGTYYLIAQIPSVTEALLTEVTVS